MTGPEWLGGAFALLSLAGAGVFVVAAVGRREVGRRDDRAAHLAHAAMALGMAGMFAPWGDPVPAAAGAVVFALIGAWFAARWLRRDQRTGGDALHLVIGPAAMVAMYLGMDHGAAAGTGTGGTGHLAHGGPGPAVDSNPALALLLLVLAAYFVWHTWATAAGAGRPAPAGWTATRIAHVAMSGLMGLMLFGVH